jgi:hypothetical protein
MEVKMAEQKNDPFMNDCYGFIHEKLGTSAWIPLYVHWTMPKTNDDFLLFPALVPEDSTEQILTQYAWEVDLNSFHPDHVTHHSRGKKEVKYLRFGREDGIEPILIQRYFYKHKKDIF